MIPTTARAGLVLLALTLLGRESLQGQAANPNLRGITAVHLLINPVDPRLRGLSEGAIRQRAESVLAKGNIASVSSTDAIQSRHASMLEIVLHTSVHSGAPALVIYNLQVKYHEAAVLTKNSELLLATLWQDGFTGAVGTERGAELLESIETLLNEFLIVALVSR